MRTGVPLLVIGLLSAPFLVRAEEACPGLYEKVYGLSERQEEILKFKDGNFFDLPRPLVGEAQEINQVSVLKPLAREPLPKSTGRRGEPSLTEAKALHRRLTHDPKLDPLRCRDKQTVRGNGMCWALTVAAHLRALQSGLHNKSIRKVWAIGAFDVNGHHWRYHGATIVRVKGEGWYALDPFFARAMPLADWYASMQALDVSENMRLFATPAKRFGPSSRQKYSPTEFNRDLYEGFFRDLVMQVRSEVQRGASAGAAPVAGVASASAVGSAGAEFNPSTWARAAAAMGLGAGAIYGIYELSRE